MEQAVEHPKTQTSQYWVLHAGIPLEVPAEIQFLLTSPVAHAESCVLMEGALVSGSTGHCGGYQLWWVSYQQLVRDGE